MKKTKQKNSEIEAPTGNATETQEPYEIIYADSRDEEIYLKFLKRDQNLLRMARWVLDKDDNQLLWSDGIFEILELDPKKYGANHYTFLEMVHPEDRHIKIKVKEDLNKNKNAIEINYRLLFNDGRIKWINEICNTDFNHEGHPIRSYGIIQDITKYKIIEKHFQQKKELYKTLVESIPYVIILVQNNKFIYLNATGRQIFEGNSKELLNDKKISKIFTPESKLNLTKKLKSVALGHNVPTFEEKLKRADGSVFDAEITMTQKTYQESSVILLIINDISERKAIEEALILNEQKFRSQAVALLKNEIQLREVITTKDKFFSIIAHDLRSPFNSIIGFLDLLQSQYEKYDDTKRKYFINIIDENARKNLKLLDTLLEWAKSQSGNMSFQPATQKLLPLINEVKATLESALTQKFIKLNFSIPDQFEIYADTNMLIAILQNLITNAIKFSFSGNEINIIAELKDDMTEITIIDSGIGMSKETINNLFRIDKQVSVPGTANEKGSGLGLILCKDFVEKHKGQIWVESEPGIGSKFIFTIPVEGIQERNRP